MQLIEPTAEARAAVAASPSARSAPKTPVKSALSTPPLATALPDSAARTGSASVKITSGMGTGLSPGAGTPPIRTDVQRYQLMRETAGRRLTHGKSRIHGTGVFARVNHKAGDWLSEYCGVPLLPHAHTITSNSAAPLKPSVSPAKVHHTLAPLPFCLRRLQEGYTTSPARDRLQSRVRRRTHPARGARGARA
jgi:hypothetical protein